MNEFKYCPNCAQPIQENNEHWKCNKCGSEYWKNSKPTAAVIPIKDGKILLSKRGIEPFKGYYDTIGGFLSNGEIPLDGALREVKEETGLDVKILDFIGTYMDTYGGDRDFILCFYYVCEIVGGEMKAQDDVAALEWFDIDNLPENIAFKHIYKVIEDLKDWEKKRR